MTHARPLYFILDPFSGSRVAVGAVFGGVGQAQLLPLVEEAAFALTPLQIALVRLALQAIGRQPDLDNLPAASGPQIVFGDRLALPSGVSSPETWLRRLLVPRERKAA